MVGLGRFGGGNYDSPIKPNGSKPFVRFPAFDGIAARLNFCVRRWRGVGQVPFFRISGFAL